MNTRLKSALGILGIGGAVAVTAVAGVAAYALRSRNRWPGSSEKTPFQGKVVVITGGSRGLGFALAERFGRGGARLVLTARNPEELASARDSLLASGAVESAEDVLLVPADLTEPAQAAKVIERTIADFGHIDVLINNAGIIEVGPFENQSLEAFTRGMDTNFFAALHTIRAALPYMLWRSRSWLGGAAIVNIASVGGKIPVPHMLPYVASKFALTGFSEGLHAELRQEGIRVTTVCPGLMRTGGEVHAHYTGQVDKEERWFSLSARTPIIAASAKHAAGNIYRAVAQGRAEITITPQAWLAARIAGAAPEVTQFVAALANRYVLPSPAAIDPNRLEDQDNAIEVLPAHEPAA